ncbi:MAG: TonB-dependent receptor [Porticoccaceae bacterium]
MKTLRYRHFALPLLLLSPEPLAHTIEELVITASPHGKQAEEIPGALSVMSGAALRREIAATLGETLQNQPGMHSSSFGPGVGLPVIRGMDGNRVELLNNGNTVADASATSPDHAAAVEPLLADRIEILRGPATLRYGPGAIGGVINVIDSSIHTERLEGTEAAAEIRHNTNNHENALVGRLDGGSGNLAFHLAGVVRNGNNVQIPGAANRSDPQSSRGHVDNSDSDVQSWVFGLSQVTDRLVAGVSVSRLDSDYGIPTGGHHHSGHHEHHDHDHDHDHDHEEHSHEDGHHHDSLLTRIDLEQTIYQGKFLLRDLDGFVECISLNVNHSDYRHKEIEIDAGEPAIGTRFAIDSTELRAELSHAPVAGWEGTLGAQHKRRDFDARGLEAFVAPSDTRNLGFYLIEETTTAIGTLELGVRHDSQHLSSADRHDIDHNSLNASASLLYPLNDTQRLGLILSRTERAPVAEELLSDGEHVATRTYEIGNPHLDAESAWNAELTWHHEGALQASVSLFYRRFSDFIYALDSGERFNGDLAAQGFSGLHACSAAPGDFANEEDFSAALDCFVYTQSDATFTGMEAEISIPIGDTQDLRLWGDTVRGRFDDAGDVPRMPPARIGANWDIHSGPWNTRLSFTYAMAQNRPGHNQTATASHTRLDAHVRYGLGNWSLFLKGSNLTDREIRNAASFLRDIAPEPGRSITLGASYNF